MTQIFMIPPGDVATACWTAPRAPSDPIAREAHAWAWFAALFGAPLEMEALLAIRSGRSAPWPGFLQDDPEGAAVLAAIDRLLESADGADGVMDKVWGCYGCMRDAAGCESAHAGETARCEMAGLLDRIGLDAVLPTDHVATELRALALLTRREDPRRGPMLWRLAHWMPALRAACAACDPTGLYAAAAAALEAEVMREASAIFPELPEPSA